MKEKEREIVSHETEKQEVTGGILKGLAERRQWRTRVVCRGERWTGCAGGVLALLVPGH